MASPRRKYLLFGVLGIVSLVLDQISKIWARGALGPETSGKIKEVFGREFFFRYAENPGVAFSMFRTLPGGRWILTAVAVAALGLVIQYLRKTDPSHTRLHVALGLMGGGAVGNLIDRIVYGKVADFIVADLGFWPLNPWPAFNVADAVLVVGVGLMALDMFKSAAPETQKATGNT